MEIVKKEVKIVDKDHIWIDGVQYISLQRFSELKREQTKEMINLNNEIKTLYKENKAYKTILKIEGDTNE